MKLLKALVILLALVSCGTGYATDATPTPLPTATAAPSPGWHQPGCDVNSFTGAWECE